MATGESIVLSVRNLAKSYRSAGEEVAVLRGVNLDIAAGERVALSGESGSGKSTLLHLIAGLDAADGGEIRLADIPVSELSDAGRAALRRDRLGLVLQQFNLIPSLSVADNLKFQSRIAGRHDAAWHGELVERLGLGALLKRYPEQLSGGQQQRVAIGRALAVKPLLLLADEPTGNLDPETSFGIMQQLHRINKAGTTVVVATHDSHMVDCMQRRVLELQGGRLIRDEASGLYRQLDQSTAEFDALLRSDDGMPIPRRAPTQRSEQELFDAAFQDD